MKKIEHALIMAAGRGMRMMPLTNDIPKPMIPFEGSTLIAHGIQEIKKHVPNIHITVGYKGAVLAEHVIKIGVTSVFNTEGKGNSWWIYNTLIKYLNEPVFVLTCDNVVEIDFASLSEEYYKCGEPAGVIVPVAPIKGFDGDYIFKNGNVVNRISRTDVADIYCSGIQIINPVKVNALTSPTESFYEVWQQLIAKQQLYCSSFQPKKWLAIDTMQQLQAASGKK
jgi:NDP-sugar pyrophosphorylase family protein